MTINEYRTLHWSTTCIYSFRRFAATHGANRHPDCLVVTDCAAGISGEAERFVIDVVFSVIIIKVVRTHLRRA